MDAIKAIEWKSFPNLDLFQATTTMLWLAVFSALTLSVPAYYLDYKFWSCSSIPEVEQVEFCRADIGRLNVHAYSYYKID